MKKFIALAAVVLTVAAGATSAFARGDAEPLYEATGFGCGVIDRGGGFVLTFESYLVWRKNGNVYLRCEANGTAGSTIETTEGFGCGLLQFGSTTDSINVVRRAGRIQLECWGYSDPAVARLAATSLSAGAG
jgi:hypothetical protein